jgi:Uncharacterized protein containing a Zn-ribbon
MVEIPKNIPSHKHCTICGKSIPVDKEFCSPECEEQYRAIMKKRKRSNYLLMGMMVLILLILFLPFLLGRQ